MTTNHKMLFFCPACGDRLKNKTGFCGRCGFDLSSDAPFSRTAPGGSTGWSERIRDPRFAAYRKNSTIYIWIWTGALAVAVPALLLASGEFDSPAQALTVGGVICGMFLLIGLFSSLKTAFGGKGWEGDVVYKAIADRKKSIRDDDGQVQEIVTEYAVHVRTTGGKIIVLTYENDDTMYNYLNVGDRLRRHARGKISYIEKYDKSHDSFLFCAACGYRSDIRADWCRACGCPLLK